MKKPAAADAAAQKRKNDGAQEPQRKHARPAPDQPATGDDVSALRQNQASVGEELRRAEAEQTAQKAKLKQAEKDAKDAREALARLDGQVTEKRAAFRELTQQVSAAVHAKGATKVSVALGPPIFYKAADIHFSEEDAGGDLECNISAAVQAECYQVVQYGHSAKVIRYERSSEESKAKSGVPSALEEPKKPRSAYSIWVDDNRSSLAEEAGTTNASGVAKLAGQKWKALGETALQSCHQKANVEKTAYEAAMEEFVKAGGVKGSGRVGRKEKKCPQVSDFVVSCNHICDEGDASGSVVCTTISGREVGKFAVPPGEDALGMWLPGNVLQSALVPKKCRLRLVNLQGDVFWTESDDAARPLVNSIQQLDRLKKQHEKEGRIVAATQHWVTTTLLEALNFGDDACLGSILLGSHHYPELSSIMPKNAFLKDYQKEPDQLDNDYDALMFVKAKLVRGLGLDKSVSNFLIRQVQRGCQTLTVSYIGDKNIRKRARVCGKSQRKMLISGCSPLEASSSVTGKQLEEVMVIDVDFDFDGRLSCDGVDNIFD